MSSIIINSTHITDTVNNSTFDIEFERGIDLNNKHIALTSATLYFSWRNITRLNNKLSYIWIDNTEYFIVLPIGFYEVTDIVAYLQYVMGANNHTMNNIETGSITYFIDLVISNTLYSIDILTYPVPTSLPNGFSSSILFPNVAKNPILKIPSGMNDILGYNANFQTDAAYEIKIYNSQKAPNVSPDSTVLIVCDQVQNPFSNLGVLYAISPSVSIGSLIIDKPSYPIYSNLKSGFYNRLTFRILSSKTYRPMEILDPEINFIFSIKESD